MSDDFSPPRGGWGKNDRPVPSAIWQSPDKIKASALYRYRRGGFFLGWSDKAAIGVDDDRHIGIVAGARAGKTSTLLIPNLRLYSGPAVVLDPKGELASETAGKRSSELRQAVHVLDPWGVANVPDALRASFDPLAELLAAYRDDVAAGRLPTIIDDVSLICEALIQDSGDDKGKHWTDSARDVLRGVILWQIFVAPDEWRGLHRLPKVLAEAMRKGDDDDSDFFATLAGVVASAECPEAVSDVIATTGAGMMGTPSGERASILSTARNQLGFLESPQMAASLVRSTFRVADMKRGEAGKPVSVYLCLPASRMGTHSKWLRLFLNMAIAALERDKSKPPRPVLLMLEEFAALGHMRALEQAAAYMAGFSVKLCFVVQDLTQLKRHYKDGWETFLGNCGTLIAFGNADKTTLDYLSQKLGETAVFLTETQRHGTGATTAGAPGTRENFQRVPLLAPHEIGVLFGRDKRRALVMVAGGNPVALTRRFIDDPAFSPLLTGQYR